MSRINLQVVLCHLSFTLYSHSVHFGTKGKQEIHGLIAWRLDLRFVPDNSWSVQM